MIDAVAQFVKALLLPGSVTFLILAAVAGVGLLYLGDRGRRWGRRWLLALVVGYWLLGLPVVADLLTAAASAGYRPIATVADAQGAAAIVVLDGGTSRYHARGVAFDVAAQPSAFRLIEAVRVYRLLDHPLVIVTAGTTEEQDASRPEGVGLRDGLIDAGVPPDRVVLDTTSPNTRQHALTLAPFLQGRGIKRVVLVTSATHIRRAVWTFESAGIDVVPSPAATHSDDPRGWSRARFWPSPDALQVSEDALRDLLGIVYYWSRGWLN